MLAQVQTPFVVEARATKQTVTLRLSKGDRQQPLRGVKIWFDRLTMTSRLS